MALLQVHVAEVRTRVPIVRAERNRFFERPRGIGEPAHFHGGRGKLLERWNEGAVA